MPARDKRQSLLRLSRARQRTALHGYGNVADYHGGAYECDWVSPYTKGACNVDADVFVLLQDWASEDLLDGPFDYELHTEGHMANVPTNRNLKRLLNDTFSCDLKNVFATNLFPFIKRESASSYIPRKTAGPRSQDVRPALTDRVAHRNTETRCGSARRGLRLRRRRKSPRRLYR
jgi:hypothetical protein